MAAIVSGLALAAAAVGCGGAGVTAGDQIVSGTLTPATLTVWVDGAPDPTMTAVASAFERLHPQIEVRLVAEPGSNYFSLVHAANIAHTGPDVEEIWPGYYAEQNAPWLVRLNRYIPQATLARLVEPQYSALNFNVNDGIYIAPVITQYYIGIYNTTLFAKAGISSPPQDWSQLYTDCARLKAIGVTPMEYGNEQANGASNVFYVAFDLSYLLAGVLAPQQFPRLYTGQVPWDSQALVQQVKDWSRLHSMGCTNADTLTNKNAFQAYSSGKAAMVITGDWELSPGNALSASTLRFTAPFTPPFSATPKQNLVAMSGYGFGATSYGSHVSDAVAFLKFYDSAAAQRLVEADYNPGLKGLQPGSQLDWQHKELLAWTYDGRYTIYPFIDNLLQPAVYAAAQSVLPEAFVGQMSASGALGSIQQSLDALPASERTLGSGSTY